jgi:hypothetical protein
MHNPGTKSGGGALKRHARAFTKVSRAGDRAKCAPDAGKPVPASPSRPAQWPPRTVLAVVTMGPMKGLRGVGRTLVVLTTGPTKGSGVGGGWGRLPRAQGVMKQVHQQGAERSSQGEPAQPETPASRSLEWEAAVAAPHPRPPRSCHRGTTLPVACGTACGQSADRGPLTRSPRAQQPSVSSLRGVRRTTVDVTPLGPTVVTRGPVKGLSVGVMMGVCLSARASGGFEGEAQGRGVTRVMHAEAATRRTWSGWQ